MVNIKTSLNMKKITLLISIILTYGFNSFGQIIPPSESVYFSGEIKSESIQSLMLTSNKVQIETNRLLYNYDINTKERTKQALKGGTVSPLNTFLIKNDIDDKGGRIIVNNIKTKKEIVLVDLYSWISITKFSDNERYFAVVSTKPTQYGGPEKITIYNTETWNIVYQKKYTTYKFSIGKMFFKSDSIISLYQRYDVFSVGKRESYKIADLNIDTKNESIKEISEKEYGYIILRKHPYIIKNHPYSIIDTSGVTVLSFEGYRLLKHEFWFDGKYLSVQYEENDNYYYSIYSVDSWNNIIKLKLPRPKNKYIATFNADLSKIIIIDSPVENCYRTCNFSLNIYNTKDLTCKFDTSQVKIPEISQQTDILKEPNILLSVKNEKNENFSNVEFIINNKTNVTNSQGKIQTNIMQSGKYDISVLYYKNAKKKSKNKPKYSYSITRYIDADNQYSFDIVLDKAKKSNVNVNVSDLETPLYTQAVSTNTIATYNEFLDKYPSAKYHKEVQLKKQVLIDVIREQAFFEYINKSYKFVDCYEYLRIFPDGKNSNKVKAIKSEIELYQSILDNPSIEKCEQYYSNYSSGRFVKNVKEVEDYLPCKDSRDGKTYKTVKIDKQVWMAENLAYKASSGCWAYDNDQSNVSKYGYLYNWETAENVCPSGWHLPTDAEWTTLENYLGGRDVAGGKMKSTIGWDSPNKSATNSSGFSALPAGDRNSEGESNYFSNTNAHFWSSTLYGDSERFAWKHNLSFNSGEVSRSINHPASSYSVRCIKD